MLTESMEDMEDGIPRALDERMTDAERVRLLDATMRSHAPVAYVEGVRSAFEIIGRLEDALTAAAISELHGSGEIETLMFMRAEWMGKRSSAHPQARST